VPRYNYKCRECEIEFEISHPIYDKLTDCGDCKTNGSLFRMITDFRTSGLETPHKGENNKPGKVVNEFIKNASRELKEYKDNITESVSSIDEVSE
jgi:putative FmdB family regulatory protein